VAAGQSAELMEQLNLLVNAGHSPSSLARQMVRYLRNALMAKLGGEQTELLQISGDERARAARTALLFTEEELTRNLQIVLRTFDDLNYRQEQRFHLELGLLKLIHAQRLIPLEELLSGVAAGAGSRSGGTAPRAVSTSARPAPSAALGAEPSISPFTRTKPDFDSAPRTPSAAVSSGPRLESKPATVSTMETPGERTATVPAISPFSGSTPFPATGSHAATFASTATLTEGALAKVPDAETQPASAPSVDSLRQAIVPALSEGGHVSAAQLLGTGTWTFDGGLRIEVPGMGKKMIALTINAGAEKIIRQELQRLGAPARFLVVPGEGVAAAGAQIAATPLAGSIQEAALANPLIQRAKEIFQAEVRSVVDLRLK
jgi:DNA polymerase-3 subunit gamma/tau